MSSFSLEHVTIDGFRGLKNLHLDDLGLINILVGPNNSGKTSVLEALSILCNPVDPQEWIWVARRRDFGGLDETRIQSLRWCFTHEVEPMDADTMFKGECKMTCAGRFPLKKLTARYEEIEAFDTIDESGKIGRARTRPPERELDLEPRRGAQITHTWETDGALLRSGISVDQPVTIQVWEHYPVPPGSPPRRRSRVPTETLTPYSYQINPIQTRSYSRHLLGPGRDAILRLVREFDSDITEVQLASFRGVRPAIYLVHKRLGSAPLSVFGDALRRAVLLASTTFSLKDGGILLVDEIETGIHVSALQRVFHWLTETARALRVQVVATTHSLEAVDAIALASPGRLSDLVTYHLDQTEHETRAKRIDGELLLRLRRDRGLDVR